MFLLPDGFRGVFVTSHRLRIMDAPPFSTTQMDQERP